jgi:heat shock protein HtpX
MGATGLRTHICNNNLKSLLLLAGFPVLLIAIAFAFSLVWSAGAAEFETPGWSGPPTFADHVDYAWSILPRASLIALGAAGVWFLIAWFFHQGMIDAATGARKVDRKDEPELYNLLENLCISRGMTMPHLRIIETSGMNAYASGLREGQYSVTVTRGLMQALDTDELEAVLAHELSHIRHADVRLLVVSIIFVGIISFVLEVSFRGVLRGLMGRAGGSRRGSGGNAGAIVLVVFAILAVAYLLAIIIRFTLSRKREYMADAGAVELTKKPDAMISALEKISGNAEVTKAPSEIREMFIENPKDSAGFMGLFMTHPPIPRRIEALREFAGGSPGIPDASPPHPTVPQR